MSRQSERSAAFRPSLSSLVFGLAFWSGLTFGCHWMAQAQAPVQMSSDSGKVPLPRIEQYHGAVGCVGGVPAVQHLRAGVNIARWQRENGTIQTDTLLVPVLDSLTRAEVTRHEAAHFVQLAASANCDSVMATWRGDPRQWLVAEAEAACTGFQVYREAARRKARQTAYVLLLGFRRPAGISYGDVRQAFDEACL